MEDKEPEPLRGRLRFPHSVLRAKLVPAGKTTNDIDNANVRRVLIAVASAIPDGRPDQDPGAGLSES